MTDKTTEFTIEALPLRLALETALKFVSNDNWLPTINGVNVKALTGAVQFAATDRYMLSWETVKADGEPFTFLMPVDSVKRLLAIVPKPMRSKPLKGTVTFAKAGDRVTATVAEDLDATFTFTPVDAAFVDYQDMIDKAAAQEGSVAGLTFHCTPYVMGRAFQALKQRFPNSQVRVRVKTPLKPILIDIDTDEDPLGVLVMPARSYKVEYAEDAS